MGDSASCVPQSAADGSWATGAAEPPLHTQRTTMHQVADTCSRQWHLWSRIPEEGGRKWDLLGWRCTPHEKRLIIGQANRIICHQIRLNHWTLPRAIIEGGRCGCSRHKYQMAARRWCIVSDRSLLFKLSFSARAGKLRGGEQVTVATGWQGVCVCVFTFHRVC